MRPGTGGPQRRPNPQAAASAVAMSGAVDLAALKARNEAAARAAESPSPPAGGNVVDVTEATFQSDVLDRSFQVPVLLDLWADWCQPCKQLSPVLERLAAEANGTWVLAKIDVDANQRIAQALQVQSIPSVFAVIGGQLVPGFQGALPEAQVREFIGAVLDAAAQAGLTGAPGAPADGAANGAAEQSAPEPPEDVRFTAAEAALEAGDYDLAEQRYQAILAEEPANTEAQLALRQVALLRRLETVDRDAVSRAESSPADVDAQLAAADLALANNDVQGALDRLLRTVSAVSGDDRDRVRQRLLEYFDLLGPDDPRVPPARRALTRALF
jgi:putative thioredoxin